MIRKGIQNFYGNAKRGLGVKLIQGIPNRSQELLDVWVCHKLLLAILDCQLQPTTKTSEMEVAPRSTLLALLTMLTWFTLWTWFTLLTCLIA